MAYIIGSDTNYLAKTSGFSSSGAKTAIVHVKWPSSGAGNDGLFFRMTGGSGSESASQLLVFHNTGGPYIYGSTLLSGSTTASTTGVLNEWFALVLRDDGSNNTSVKYYRQSTDTWVTLVTSSSASDAIGTTSRIRIGADSGSLHRQLAAVGTKFAYFRYWDSTHLSDAQCKTEILSATPVISATTSEPLTSVGSLTQSGGSFDSDVPSYIGSGSSIAPKAAYYSMLRRA